MLIGLLICYSGAAKFQDGALLAFLNLSINNTHRTEILELNIIILIISNGFSPNKTFILIVLNFIRQSGDFSSLFKSQRFFLSVMYPLVIVTLELNKM